jgi:hypothetical protein
VSHCDHSIFYTGESSGPKRLSAPRADIQFQRAVEIQLSCFGFLTAAIGDAGADSGGSRMRAKWWVQKFFQTFQNRPRLICQTASLSAACDFS